MREGESRNSTKIGSLRPGLTKDEVNIFKQTLVHGFFLFLSMHLELRRSFVASF